MLTSIESGGVLKEDRLNMADRREARVDLRIDAIWAGHGGRVKVTQNFLYLIWDVFITKDKWLYILYVPEDWRSTLLKE